MFATFVGVDEREVGMRKFLDKHAAATTGTPYTQAPVVKLGR